MIGLILVTHGNLADQFVEAMEHVVGKQTGIETVCIGPNDDMEQRRAEIARAIESVEAGSGVIILTDLFGGTPSNLAISLLDTGHVEVIAGINLPMLIRLAGARKSMDVVEAVEAAQEAGRNYIVNKRGLHARASAKFVGAVAALPEGINVRVAKDGNEAAGGSILGLMMLGAAKGDNVDIIVAGDNAESVLGQLVGLIEDGFGEE